MTVAKTLGRYRGIVDDWDELVAASTMPLPTSLVINTVRTDREDVQRRLAARGVETSAVDWADDVLLTEERGQPGTRFEYLAGLYNVQEEVAVVPVKLLDPQPGERVLDLCAAPGNKTAQLAMALRNRGTVVANDVSYQRMRAVRGLLDRFGLVNVCLTNRDGRKYPRVMGEFDRVLVDAPCSCEGTSRKRARSRRKQQPTIPDYELLARVQVSLLKRALELCRPGGRVVYSTCTYAPEENEAVVDEALRAVSFDVDIAEASVDGLSYSQGLTSWKGQAFHPHLSRTMRFWPHQNDTGGFYVAVLEKTSDDATSRAPEVCDTLDVVDSEPWLAPLRDRFGWHLDGYSLHEPNTKDVWIVNDDARPAPRSDRTSAGVSFLRKAMLHPKPTTAAAMLLGPRATRNVADLSEAQTDHFLRRGSVALSGEQAESHDSAGYVLIRCHGLVVGVGRVQRDRRTIESFYPKAWALGEEMSAFEEGA